MPLTSVEYGSTEVCRLDYKSSVGYPTEMRTREKRSALPGAPLVALRNVRVYSVTLTVAFKSNVAFVPAKRSMTIHAAPGKIVPEGSAPSCM